MLKEQFKQALGAYLNVSSTRPLEKLCSDQIYQETPFVVAYSGGMDSHVLLQLCVDHGLNVRAVYIHHGLQAEADSWQQHCQSVCEKLKVKFVAINVDAKSDNGQSPEEAARNARYTALKTNLKPQEYLLTAHHKDDQAETLLLQLFRGSGPAGLASMPGVQPFGEGFHCRPMLDLSRDEIRLYAQDNQLVWIEDPSNNDLSFDRNFLRQQIFPALQKRWPQVSHSIKQAADIQQENLDLIQTMAAIDLASVSTNNPCELSVHKLLTLSSTRQFNVLRFWIKRAELDRPTRNVIQQIQTTVLPAAEDAEPLVSWDNTEVRRYKEVLYLMSSLKAHDEASVYQWDPAQNLDLHYLDLTLSINQPIVKGLSLDLLSKKLEIKFRVGGEKIKPAGKNHTASLKKLMQQQDVPPWMRSRIPLLYADGELVCVCGFWVADEYANDGDEGWLPLVASGEGQVARG